MTIDLQWLLMFLGALGGYLVKWAFEKISKQNEDTLKENTEATVSLTHSVIKLEVKMDLLLKAVEKIPELEKDVARMGASMRELRGKIQ
jgi:hypothetical protein